MKVTNYPTKRCVRCFKPATFWAGHILREGQKIVAGWCSEKCANAKGFYGHYRSEMGRRIEQHGSEKR